MLELAWPNLSGSLRLYVPGEAMRHCRLLLQQSTQAPTTPRSKPINCHHLTHVLSHVCRIHSDGSHGVTPPMLMIWHSEIPLVFFLRIYDQGTCHPAGGRKPCLGFTGGFRATADTDVELYPTSCRARGAYTYDFRMERAQSQTGPFPN